MKIIVIGANGQLGHDLVRIIPKEECIPFTRKELDLAEVGKIKETLAQHKPDIVINTAAFNRVDDCEKTPEAAFAVNAVAAHHLAKACKEIGATMVHYSTDYVFGKEKNRKSQYMEKDVPGPLSAYGVSKLAGEMLVQAALDEHYVIRVCGLFGVVGSSGKGGNFVETMLRIGKEKGSVRVVEDQVLSPTYTLDVAKNTYEMFKKNVPFGLYHMVSHGETSWYNFAKTIFELAGLNVECMPIPTSEYKLPARRPAYSALENEKLRALGIDQMRDWKVALRDYLMEKGHIS